jgi:UDP-N-acetyl-D-mannosaminuronate dehydrogenase
MLNQRINAKKIVVAVLGLGHVGYPMSSLFAKNGFQTIGFDINVQRLNDIRDGKVVSELNSIIPTEKTERQKTLSKIEKNLDLSNNEQELKNADVFVIDVPTPLTENDTPNLVYLTNTCKTVSKFLKKDNLVIVAPAQQKKL